VSGSFCLRAAVWLLLSAAVASAQTAPSISVLAQAPKPMEKEGEEKKKEDDDKNKDGDDKKKDDAPDWYNVHGQTTLIPQGNFRFHSP
jgi:hypothetical protein